ncbi:MAG: hypothetical protein QXL54_04915 [Candidatus Bathyarchaeia archaeon]
MVKLEVVQGRKAKGDKVVLVTAHREPMRIEHVLQIINVLFESEDACYPPSEGYMGRKLLYKAITAVYHGVPLPVVLEKYKLKQTRKGLHISYRLKREGE